MSRTVRYFKLIYIVAGILLSNAAICETVDRIQIAPRLSNNDEAKKQKDKLNQYSTKNLQNKKNIEIDEKKSAISRRWYHKVFIFRVLKRIQSLLWCQWRVFSIWTLFNLLVECSTRLLCRTFVLSSDCDVIYK